MRWDFRNHLLIQIEMLRGPISHEELSKKLGPAGERHLAAYIAGRTHLKAPEFKALAKALSIDEKTLARQWAASVGIKVSRKRAVEHMMNRVFQEHWRNRTTGVPPRPSPITVIRKRYSARLPHKPPALWFPSRGSRETDTPDGRQRFVRAYEMLLEAVLYNRTNVEIGALHGISGERARQLMCQAAYTWARSEGIDLIRDARLIPWKNEAQHVKNLYAGLSFFITRVNPYCFIGVSSFAEE